MQSTMCIIASSSLYANEKTKETIDVALAASVCAFKTSLLLIGESVLQLCNTNNNNSTTDNNSILTALPIYGIDKVHVDAAAISEFQIQLPINCQFGLQLLYPKEIAKFIASHYTVINL